MKQQTDVFIPDGMNAFQRHVKRVGDCLIAFIAIIVFFSFVPILLSCREAGGWRSRYIQAGAGRPFREAVLYL